MKIKNVNPKFSLSSVLLCLAMSASVTPAYAEDPVIDWNTFNSTQENVYLQIGITGQTNYAIYVWAKVEGLGEYCFTPNKQWHAPILHRIGGSLFDDSAYCPAPAGYLTSGSKTIDVLTGLDLSDPVFNKTAVYVDLISVGGSQASNFYEGIQLIDN